MENKGNNNNNGGNNNGGNNKNGMTIMVFILAALLVLFLTSLLNSCAKDAMNKEISYSEFINMVEQDKVESVTFTSNRINITPKGEDRVYRINYYTAELNDENLIPLLKEHKVKFSGTVEDVSSVILWNLLSYILPLVLVWVLLYFLIFRKMGSGGMMGVGKTTAKVYVEKSTGVTFKDVAGQEEAKESLQEVVDFLHNPRKYTDIGAKLPKGALLVGPPGTGKTLLAKAVAGEAKVPFFSLAGSDFVEMFVGVGASRVRDLFKEAQKQAPCIIFIDEIDAIGKSRDTRYGGNDEREQTLNQLLAEMDGFDTSKGLLILAATNRPEVLDKALLRPGRFDRRIIVDKPDLKGRVETLKVHAKNVLLDDSVDLDAIALATSGAVGSDLANMINEAAINAVKQGRKYVNQGDLFESVEVVIAGKEKKDRIMGPKEKKMVAYHEVGHALVTALQKDAEPVQKITIVPRTMGALGYTMQVPEEEKFLMTKNELVAHLVTYMGGRAAEEIVFDSVTTGASNDIEQATKMARAMVTQYGMSEKFGLMGLVTIENQYLDGRASLNCGEETAAQIDQEVMRILKESYDEAAEGFKAEEVRIQKGQKPAIDAKGHGGRKLPEGQAAGKGNRQQPKMEERPEPPKKPEPEAAEPQIEIQEEEIVVNTLKDEELPLEFRQETAAPAQGEPEDELFLEVNTLEGEAIPQRLADLEGDFAPGGPNGAPSPMVQNPEGIPAPMEPSGEPPMAQKPEPSMSATEIKVEEVSPRPGRQESFQAPTEIKAEPVLPKQAQKAEGSQAPIKTKAEPVLPKQVQRAESSKAPMEAKEEELPNRQGKQIEIVPEIVNGPISAAGAGLPKEPAQAQQKAAIPEKEPQRPAQAQQKAAIPEKEPQRPAQAQQKAATPEEAGFFPAKKGSGKKAKPVSDPQAAVKDTGKAPEQQKPAEPPKAKDGKENYLDELLKGLK